MADAVELYDEADKLKDAGKLEEAVAKFKEALVGRPELRAGPFGPGDRRAEARPSRGGRRARPESVRARAGRSVQLHGAERDPAARVRGHRRHELHPPGGRRDGTQPHAADARR